MKVTDVDTGLLLYTPVIADHQYDHGEEKQGFFKKHFKAFLSCRNLYIS